MTLTNTHTHHLRCCQRKFEITWEKTNETNNGNWINTLHHNSMCELPIEFYWCNCALHFYCSLFVYNSSYFIWLALVRLIDLISIFSVSSSKYFKMKSINICFNLNILVASWCNFGFFSVRSKRMFNTSFLVESLVKTNGMKIVLFIFIHLNKTNARTIETDPSYIYSC